MTFYSIKIYLAKKIKTTYQHLVLKELRRSDFLTTIVEYVGAKGSTLVDHKKIKIKKRHRRI